jgi:hypothetical protein
MVKHHVAIIAETKKISDTELTRVETTLRTRLRRDVAPIWGVTAILQSYRDRNKAGDAWPLLVRDDIDEPGAASYHSDKNGQPFAMVTYSPTWPFLVSHDLLEMLIDPHATRLVSGPDPRPGRKHPVEFLVEVCDPCAAEANGYLINDVRMADFCTPDYYGGKRPKSRYSFTGAIKKPFEVLPGGYLTWRDRRDGHWWQKTYFGPKPEFRDLGAFESTATANGDPADASVRRKRISLQSVILRQIQEAHESGRPSTRSIIEQLIAEFGAIPD